MAESSSPGILRFLFDENPDQVYMVDAASGRVLDCSAGACRALGYTRAELLGLSVSDFDEVLTHREYERLASQRTSGRDEWTIRTAHRRKDGSTFPVEVRICHAEVGGSEHTIAIARDVSRLKRLEEELRANRQQHENLLGNLPGVVHRSVITAAGPRMIWVDPRIEDLTGYPARDFLTGRRTLEGLVAGPGRAELQGVYQEALSSRGRYEVTFTFRDKDGQERTARDVGQVVAVPGEPEMLEGICFDVTERAEQERVLREALTAEHRRYEQVVAASHQVVYEEDVAHQVMVFSDTLRDVFGYTQEEHGSHPSDWRTRIHPDDAERVLEEMQLAIEGRRPVDLEYRYRHADGRYRWVWDRGVCDFEADGSPTRIVGMMQDITHRKQMEAQISSTQRMETVGALAGGVAHDVNNYLATMLGNIDLALIRLANDAEWPELVDARTAAIGCGDLVRSLLAFARQQDPVRAVLDPENLVEEAARILRRLAGPGVRLTTLVAENCPRFEADRVQVQQVLMNLVINARDAMDGAGAITIGASAERLRHPETRGEGLVVRLFVKDNGPGIAPELGERIFEPYVTTRPFGTGLGLSIVHGIARAHGGWTEVESREGEGATFSVYFPAAAES
jgi:PAS domain S-box-containing protein